MIDFQYELNRQLEAIRGEGLYRELRRVDSAPGPRVRIGGRELLNFSSNDYLGLANHPFLKEAAIRATQTHGTGSGASRLICGSLGIHHDLEETVARFKRTESGLVFSTGYAAALGTIGALLEAEDVIAIDKRVHASIIDAARLSGAKLRVFAHNDLNALERILAWADQRRAPASSVQAAPSFSPARRPRVLIVTESIFSMDGHAAPLRELVELKERYGAWLLLDEAHATGLYGRERRGLAEELGLSERIEIQMGTLGKAAGASGGYICGCRALTELLVNRARSFIFSTAPAPAASASAKAGIELIQSREGEERRSRLWRHVCQIRERLGWGSADAGSPAQLSAILPVLIGGEARAVEVAGALFSSGIFIPAVRHPTVPRGEARLRLTLSAAHSDADLDRLSEAFSALGLVQTRPEPPQQASSIPSNA